MKSRKLKAVLSAVLCSALFLTPLAGCGSSPVKEYVPEEETRAESVQETDDDKEAIEPSKDAKKAVAFKEQAFSKLSDVMLAERPSLLSRFMKLTYDDVKPSLADYEVEPDLSNIINADQFWLEDEAKEKLAANKFVVMQWGGDEFFDVYEPNRYNYIPNFVTVDSMLHTYHLYFSYLLKRTEKDELCDVVEELSESMFEGAKEQYDALSGTEWEDAAKTTLAFFSVACALYDEDFDIPKEVEDMVESDVAGIKAAEGIDMSLITEGLEDFSMYKPRGYYEGDEQLETYFRVMTWYGRLPFKQKSETLDRAALLITLLMDEDNFADWERVYTVTAFFAGASDDAGIYEYRPLAEAVYGKDPDISEIIGDTDKWEEFHKLTGELPPPQINSVPVFQKDSDEEVKEANTGFRFMGQRFTIDASIFGKLIYRAVKENSLDEYRMLPDALDVPAALGSEVAYDILKDEGNMDYKNYEENLEELKESIAEAPESTWNASLYAGWLNTLRPLLTSKGEGYPSFMQSEEWDKKNLSTFLGSYTELKHDTILYAKQIMAEMGDGGEEPEVRDDRGYVEP